MRELEIRFALNNSIRLRERFTIFVYCLFVETLRLSSTKLEPVARTSISISTERIGVNAIQFKPIDVMDIDSEQRPHTHRGRFFILLYL